MDLALRHLFALRAAPDDGAALGRFLAAIDERIVALSRAFADPSEVAQRSRIAIGGRWATCRAETPEALGAWVRRIVRRQGIREARRRDWRALDDPDALRREGVDPEPDPEVRSSDRARGEALEAALVEALSIETARLPARHQAWARRNGVSADHEIRARDVQITLASRRDGRPLAELAREMGLTLAVAKKAASRGAAAIVLGARVLAERARGWRRGALLEIVEFAGGDEGAGGSTDPPLG